MKEKNPRQNTRIMEDGSFWEILIKLALPACVVILIMIIYNMADTFFIGQTNDPNMLSAISICMPLFTVLSGLGTLFGNGGSISVSIALGEGNGDKIKQITSFCTAGAIVIGGVIGVLAFVFAGPLARLLGADAATMDYCITYLRVFSIASPLVLFTGTFGIILRSDGEAASSMVANITGSLSNIVLDALFILVFHWDVFGAALATVLGNVFSTLMMIKILKKKQAFLPERAAVTLQKDIVIPVVTLGLPMTMSTLLGSVTHTITNRLMMNYGTICLAAQSVAGKLNMVITMLVMGITMGMMPAISYNFGKKNIARMNKIVRDTALFAVALGIVLTLAVILAKDQLVASFIDNADVVSYGRTFVVASAIIGPVYGIFQICQSFLQATGKASYAIFISLLDKGLIYLPVLYILDSAFGEYGIAFSHAVTMIPCLVIAVFLALRWQRQIR